LADVTLSGSLFQNRQSVSRKRCQISVSQNDWRKRWT